MLDQVHELNYSQYYMSLPESYTIVKPRQYFIWNHHKQAALTTRGQAFGLASEDVLICVCMLDT